MKYRQEASRAELPAPLAWTPSPRLPLGALQDGEAARIPARSRVPRIRWRERQGSICGDSSGQSADGYRAVAASILTIGLRCLSTHHAHGTNSQMAKAIHANARSLGGGGPLRYAVMPKKQFSAPVKCTKPMRMVSFKRIPHRSHRSSRFPLVPPKVALRSRTGPSHEKGSCQNKDICSPSKSGSTGVCPSRL
jgi:hypothetical protein